MIFYRYLFVTITAVSCLICMVLTLFPKFMYPPLRVSVFSVFGLSFLLPIVFLNCTYDPTIALPPDWDKLASIGFIGLAGTVLYLFMLPERFLKGQVDYFGSSHNVFHTLVVVALAVDFKQSWELYRQRLNFECPA